MNEIVFIPMEGGVCLGEIPEEINYCIHMGGFIFF